MPLAAVLTVGSDRPGFETWQFLHAQDHYEIINSISRILGKRLVPYQLDPIPQDTAVWLQFHQQTHNDANSLLGLAGANLQDVNFNDPADLDAWLFLNFREHADMRAAVGI